MSVRTPPVDKQVKFCHSFFIWHKKLGLGMTVAELVECRETAYPNKRKGKANPLQGRIMAIVDVYEALVNDRPHRNRKIHNGAVETIKNLSGTHFDLELIKVFVECEHELERVEAK